MKKRYIKENKFSRELLYLLESTILVIPSKPIEGDKKTNKACLSLENRIVYDADSAIIERIRAIDNRFRNINRKAVLNSFQSERSKNSYMLS
jgi:hypothetical protein